MDEKEDVIRHEPTQRPDLGGKEVGRHEDVHVRADKLFPRRGGLALWRWRNAMTLEDVAHGLVADRIAQVGQSSHDAVVAPGAILPRRVQPPRSRPPGRSWGGWESFAVWNR